MKEKCEFVYKSQETLSQMIFFSLKANTSIICSFASKGEDLFISEFGRVRCQGVKNCIYDCVHLCRELPKRSKGGEKTLSTLSDMQHKYYYYSLCGNSTGVCLYFCNISYKIYSFLGSII